MLERRHAPATGGGPKDRAGFIDAPVSRPPKSLTGSAGADRELRGNAGQPVEGRPPDQARPFDIP